MLINFSTIVKPSGIFIMIYLFCRVKYIQIYVYIIVVSISISYNNNIVVRLTLNGNTTSYTFISINSVLNDPKLTVTYFNAEEL